MQVDAYRVASPRPNYSDEAPTTRALGKRVVPSPVVQGDKTGPDEPVVYDFDAPRELPTDDAGGGPRWLADRRVANVLYAIIIAGMVYASIVGFSH